MKIYQLVAYGNLAGHPAPHHVYSKKVYETEEQALSAMLEFKEQITSPRSESDTMCMATKALRIFVKPLELVGNKKKEIENENKTEGLC